jgi:large subunit ribosomal protein L18
MERLEQKKTRLQRRKYRVRKSVFGTAQRPRLSVYRSLKNIYAQIIDDDRGVTLCQASSQDKELRAGVSGGGNKAAAAVVGKALAARAKAQGIAQVVFDRNGRKYHGRIKTLAEAARQEGLQL